MATATWLIQTQTIAASVETTIEGTQVFERRGLVLPFQRDQKSDFANASGVEVLKSSVRQILGTRCSDGRIPGEIPWLQSFGSLLYKLRHQTVRPVVKYQARAYVVDALARWEPRIRVRRVDIGNGNRAITIRTFFYPVDANGVGRVDDSLIEVETEILKAT